MKLPYFVTAAACFANLPSSAADPLENTGEITYHTEGAMPENIVGAASYKGEQNPILSHKFIDVNEKSHTYNQHISLDEILGKGTPIVLNFWEPWCVPCMEEMPYFEALSQQKGVSVIGFSTQYYRMNNPLNSTEEKQFEHAREVLNKVTFPCIGLEADSVLTFSLLGQFSDYVFPTTVIFDAQGNLQSVYQGKLTLEQLERAIREAK